MNSYFNTYDLYLLEVEEHKKDMLVCRELIFCNFLTEEEKIKIYKHMLLLIEKFNLIDPYNR